MSECLWSCACACGRGCTACAGEGSLHAGVAILACSLTRVPRPAVRAGLVEAFRNADNGTVTRTLVVKVDVGTEEIYNVADGRASVSLQRDYSQVQTLADMHGPCWLLVKHPGPNQWRIYTYCSDNENVSASLLRGSPSCATDRANL